VYKFKLKTQFESDPMSCNSKTAFDSIEKSTLFSERTRKYLLYIHLVSIAENYSTSDLNLYFKKFQELFHDNSLNEKIRNNFLLDFVGLKNENSTVFLSDLNTQKQTLENVISSSKGKVVYVDFWASWCMPCRAAMPVSRTLQKKFKDKAVVFVFISIDNDFEKWKNASQKEKLTENPYSLIALNYPNANFFKDLQLESIPRYLIYDKAGKLVQKNAPSPESQLLISEINKYLEE
jgi:thiol-disulfide isomerase/thioredoxin